METNANTTTTDPALLNTPAARAAFSATQVSVQIYGALTAAALLAVIAVASTGHLVNPFMWVRAILLPSSRCCSTAWASAHPRAPDVPSSACAASRPSSRSRSSVST